VLDEEDKLFGEAECNGLNDENPFWWSVGILSKRSEEMMTVLKYMVYLLGASCRLTGRSEILMLMTYGSSVHLRTHHMNSVLYEVSICLLTCLILCKLKMVVRW
jgi:hypothetical protein